MGAKKSGSTISSRCLRLRGEDAQTQYAGKMLLASIIRAFDSELEPDFSAGLKHSSDDSELAELARSLKSYFMKQDLPDLQQKLKTYFSKTAHFE